MFQTQDESPMQPDATSGPSRNTSWRSTPKSDPANMSTDQLWTDDDDSFVVKATQDFMDCVTPKSSKRRSDFHGDNENLAKRVSNQATPTRISSNSSVYHASNRSTNAENSVIKPKDFDHFHMNTVNNAPVTGPLEKTGNLQNQVKLHLKPTVPTVHGAATKFQFQTKTTSALQPTTYHLPRSTTPGAYTTVTRSSTTGYNCSNRSGKPFTAPASDGAQSMCSVFKKPQTSVQIGIATSAADRFVDRSMHDTSLSDEMLMASLMEPDEALDKYTGVEETNHTSNDVDDMDALSFLLEPASNFGKKSKSASTSGKENNPGRSATVGTVVNNPLTIRERSPVKKCVTGKNVFALFIIFSIIS